MVLGKHVNLRDMIRGLAPSIRVDALSKVMVNIALNGFGQDTLDNTAIKKQAQSS